MSQPRSSAVQLSLGVAVAFVSALFLATPPFLIPALVSEYSLGLASAGLLAVLPNLGMVATLIVWGVFADRFGERSVLTLGLALTALAACGATVSRDPFLLGACFLLGGMTSASANAASGRIVIGWVRPDRRGLAMGIRQMAIPLSAMLAASAIPPLAEQYGIAVALMLPAVSCAFVLPCCALWLRNPERPSQRPSAPGEKRADNPYRKSRYLVRIHTASTILCIPQFALLTFGLVWMMSDLGWSAAAAGAMVGVAQFLGAMGRVAVGAYSDVIGRTAIIRYISVLNIAALVLTGFAAYMQWSLLAVVFFILATCLSVADNGPAFTTVAEVAGPFWSGRALGIQNTSQHFAGFLVGPAVGVLIELIGFPAVLAMLAIAPVLALPFVPRTDRRYED